MLFDLYAPLAGLLQDGVAATEGGERETRTDQRGLAQHEEENLQ